MLGWQQRRSENGFANNWLSDSKSLTSQDLHLSIYKMIVLVIISIVQCLLSSEVGQFLQVTNVSLGWVQEIGSFSSKSSQFNWKCRPAGKDYRRAQHPPRTSDSDSQGNISPLWCQRQVPVLLQDHLQDSKPPTSQNLLHCHHPNPSTPRLSLGILLLGLPASVLAFLESILFPATQKLLKGVSDD